MKREALAEKIIVVGIDGFDPLHAKYVMDQGRMPALKEFVERGSARKDLVMLGSMPTVTPPMWTTLATGAPAGVHGITGFFNQHPTKIDTCIYALDSRLCKAELLWDIFADAGKKTLVWHWPGSSWPPTSQNPNLAVVDGTQPNNLSAGTALIDWDKILLADESFKSVQFAAHDATDKGVNGCVITGLEDTVAKDTSPRSHGAEARKVIAGGTKEVCGYAMSDEDTELNALTGSNADIVNSPIKYADEKWTHAPKGAKECTLIISSGLARRYCLILQNEDGKYDRVAIYRTKKDEKPIVVLKKGEYVSNYVDEILKGEEKKTGSRCAKVVELAEDGSRVRLWLGYAANVEDDLVWHPKALLREVTQSCGMVPLVPQLSGAEQENVTELLLPGWDVYTQWQADCLTHFMDQGKFDIIFSHVHNVDALGHKFWHYAKHRAQWGNDAAFYQEAIDKVYEQTDRYLARFLPYLDKGWTIIITSDHGLITEENQPPVLTEGLVSIPVMRELGYTVMKKDENGNDIKEIDWEKTRALALRGGQIYINLKGRDEHGIVDPADKYELEGQIISDLYNYRDPRTGKRVVAVALRNKDAVLLGEGGPECGDITFFMEEGYNIIHMDSLSTQQGYYHTSVSPIFVAAGKGIKAGYEIKRNVRELDVAPTLAALGGVRIPEHNEGSIVTQILDEEF